MNKIQRGLKAAATLLSLLAVGGVAGLSGQSTLYAQHAGCSTCSQPAPTVYTQSPPVHVASARPCGCKSCLKRVATPQCDCQFCELDVKKGEVEKSHYKTEQKEVCVPAVRMPWKKGCPPTRSKVRTVNVLKKEKYKVPVNEYKWKVHEPEGFEDPKPAEAKASKHAKSGQNGLNLTPEQLKEFDLKPGEEIISIVSDPNQALGNVPRPPVEAK